MKYCWKSELTGELVRDLYEVLITIFLDCRDYKIWNLNWKYKKEGF